MATRTTKTTVLETEIRKLLTTAENEKLNWYLARTGTVDGKLAHLVAIGLKRV